MGKLSDTGINGFILVLLAVLIIIVHQPVRAGQTEVETAMPPSATLSPVISVLARQVAFVKTFSIDFPYQYEPGSSDGGKNRHMKGSAKK